MKKIAKKNQIVIATLAVMIAAAGYMNYSGKLFPNKTKTQETNSELAALRQRMRRPFAPSNSSNNSGRPKGKTPRPSDGNRWATAMNGQCRRTRPTGRILAGVL